MEKKQVVVTEGNPLILAAGGTYGFDTITLMPGGRIRIQARPCLLYTSIRILS